jgi:hypothetical protein
VRNAIWVVKRATTRRSTRLVERSEARTVSTDPLDFT